MIALDLIDGSSVPNLKEGHLNIHKMLLTVCYALSINYERTPTNNPFKYITERHRCAKIKKELSYQNLKSKLTMKNIVDVSTIIGKLNSINDSDDTKKKMEQ